MTTQALGSTELLKLAATQPNLTATAPLLSLTAATQSDLTTRVHGLTSNLLNLEMCFQPHLNERTSIEELKKVSVKLKASEVERDVLLARSQIADKFQNLKLNATLLKSLSEFKFVAKAEKPDEERAKINLMLTEICLSMEALATLKSERAVERKRIDGLKDDMEAQRKVSADFKSIDVQKNREEILTSYNFLLLNCYEFDQRIDLISGFYEHLRKFLTFVNLFHELRYTRLTEAKRSVHEQLFSRAKAYFNTLPLKDFITFFENLTADGIIIMGADDDEFIAEPDDLKKEFDAAASPFKFVGIDSKREINTIQAAMIKMRSAQNVFKNQLVNILNPLVLKIIEAQQAFETELKRFEIALRSEVPDTTNFTQKYTHESVFQLTDWLSSRFYGTAVGDSSSDSKSAAANAGLSVVPTQGSFSGVPPVNVLLLVSPDLDPLGVNETPLPESPNSGLSLLEDIDKDEGDGLRDLVAASIVESGPTEKSADRDNLP